MAYDADLAERLRALLAPEPDVTEKRMFGGLAFLLAGHLAVAASGSGGLLVRVDPDDADDLIEDDRAGRFVMRGRQLDGWLRVDVDPDADDLPRWVGLGVACARSLPRR